MDGLPAPACGPGQVDQGYWRRRTAAPTPRCSWWARKHRLREPHRELRRLFGFAWAGIQSADAQISAANAAVTAGRTVLDGVIQERDLGTRTTLDVLNAQAELTTAREGFINASTNKVLATFSLLSAMGHLTARDLGLNVEVKSAVTYSQTVDDVWQELRTISE